MNLFAGQQWRHRHPWVGPGKPNLPLGLRGKAGGGARVTAGSIAAHGIFIVGQGLSS